MPAPARWAARRGPALAAASAAALVAAALSFAPAIEALELSTHDLRFQLRGPRRTAAKVVFAAITSRTLDAWPELLALQEPRFAAAIRQARRLGASCVGLDVIPAVGSGGTEDRELPAALRNGRVVLATSATMPPRPALIYALPDPTSDLGTIDVPMEADGAARRGVVFAGTAPQVVPGFAAALALSGHGPATPAALRALAPPSGRAAPGTIWINYVGGNSAFLRIVPAEKLAAGQLDDRERAWLRGATVIIGPAFDASDDRQRTPIGPRWGSEVFAEVFATLVDGRPLRRAGPAQEAGLAALLAALAALGAACLPVGRGLALAVGLTGLWTLAAAQSFSADLLLPVVAPAVGIALAWAGQAGVRAVAEWRERRQVEAIFRLHVGAAIAERSLREPDAATRAGERRDVTVLFVDLRGFTRLSEQLAPEALFERLNEFLPEMAGCVHATGGTIDRYTGDGLMAVWNAPGEQPDHPRRGVAAAWEMLRALERLNERRAARGEPRQRIGIGLNSGPVTAGYVGSEQLRSYTVHGSTVNLAARLESANKELGTAILLGKATYEFVREWVEARPRRIALRGFSRPQIAYELVSVDSACLDRPPAAGSAPPA